MRYLLILFIKFYQKFLTRFTPDCIYEPSCSQYCLLAIEKYGVWKGLRMFKARINRCDMEHIHNYGMKDYP